MHYYFISDLHLSKENPETLSDFKNFSQNCIKPNSQVYILGDLFEVWIGDDHEDNFFDEVKKNISAISENGNELFFCHGNRDFLIGEKFLKETQMTLMADETCITINDLRLLIMHGDQLCTHDVAYQEFRSMVRSPDWKNSFLSLEIEEREEKARQLREKSKQSNANKSDVAMDTNSLTVREYFENYNPDILIHGHTHKPAIHNETFFIDKKIYPQPSHGIRVVLGDWDKKEKVLCITDNQLTINHIGPDGLEIIKQMTV